MIALLVLLGGCAPAWTEEGAVAPTLAHVDADQDGKVSAKEYEAVRFRGPPFAEVDADGNGAISRAELLALVLDKDPTALQPTRPSKSADANKRASERKVAGEAGKAGGAKGGGPASAGRADGAPQGRGRAEDRPADERQLREEAALVTKTVLLALKEEIRAVDPNQPTPTDDAIKVAASTSDLRTAESRAVLAELEAASIAVGIPFPAPLTAAALAEVPVTPTVPLEELPRETPRVHLGPDGNPIRPGDEPPAHPSGPAPTGLRTPGGSP